MITNRALLAAWEAQEQAADTLSFEQKRRLVEAMYQLARHMGHFTDKDVLEGLDTRVTLATYVNAHVRQPAVIHRPLA
ncbi:MAG TPA: hypothetical protein VF799_01150 [Geobacteraceae bacterium]